METIECCKLFLLRGIRDFPRPAMLHGPKGRNQFIRDSPQFLRFMYEILPCQLVCDIVQICYRQVPGLHLLVDFRQFMCFVNDKHAVISQQRLPAVLSVYGIRQKVIVIADLNQERAAPALLQIPLVPTSVARNAVFRTSLRHADMPPVISRQALDLIQIQAGICIPKHMQPPSKLFPALCHFLLSFQQAQVTDVAALSLAKYSLYRFFNTSVLR